MLAQRHDGPPREWQFKIQGGKIVRLDVGQVEGFPKLEQQADMCWAASRETTP